MEPRDQETLMAAARAEFAEKGFSAASLNAILDQCGVSKGAFYYHFDNKHDLFHAVVTDFLAPLLTSIPLPGDAADPEGFWREVRDYFQRLTERMMTEPHAMPLMRNAAALMHDPEWRHAISTMQQAAMEPVLGVVRRGQDVGAVRTDIPAELIALLVFAVDEQFDRWVLPRVDTGDATVLQHWSDIGFDLIWRIASPPEVIHS